MDYYNKGKHHMDKCLGDMINYICDKAHEMCEVDSCDHPGTEHISTYTHNDGRISFSVEELPDPKLKHLNDEIIMWTQCKLCSSKTPLVQMSQSTYFYSFAKYLEVLFYNEDFACKGLCSHVELRDTLLRYFRRGDLVVKVKYEHVDLFEMRLPKLQINPDLNKTPTGVEDAEKLFVIDEEDERRLNNETRLEITYFYGAVKQHITTLEDYFYEILKKSNSNDTAGTTLIKDDGDNEMKASERAMPSLRSLDELTQTFRTEEFELYRTLKNTKVTVLNNVRQSLVERIRATKKRLTEWQKEHVDPEYLNNLKIKWVEPEYSSSTNCHVFTGSPIIVREDETSSIIAFTLSSQDYFKELALMRSDVGEKSQSAPVTPAAELHVPQASSSFSTLLNSLRNPSSSNLATKKDSDSDGTDSDSFTMVDEYSTKIKRKYINVKDNGLGDRITHGIESLGSIKAFNISSLSSKDKKKDPEKESEKAKKFTGLFGMNSVDPEKKRNDENNEKQELDQSEVTAMNGRLSSSESEKPKAKEEANADTIALSESFGWGRKNSQKSKEKDSPHIKHGKLLYSSEDAFSDSDDDRLVIKQIVSSWRVAEKEGFLRFAPKYFEYMDKAPNMPSVLAKIFGFYTVKIKDLKKNNVILKMDLIVMEHLFFSKTITWKFDLKGIQERHIKDQTKQEDSTMWDGDWVEGQYKSRLLIHSHSEKLLKKALDNDTKFLCDANIMDYSLLVGVDEKRKELVAGIVDFIGAYTFYKKIENKGKTLGRSAREVTVLPPDQYKERFGDSIKQYFLPVPGFEQDDLEALKSCNETSRDEEVDEMCPYIESEIRLVTDVEESLRNESVDRGNAAHTAFGMLSEI
ncbi:791_t:CDS:10 [Acaulospora colombiana]|uniref:791_t:CDS:1 n=1 Tax=Acaulospora colombiana TaxID=27376 RepID=A0ACA9LUC9_9GLOM|nr:791_t:CDS:10 [Acaulospora colombiana]